MRLNEIESNFTPLGHPPYRIMRTTGAVFHFFERAENKLANIDSIQGNLDLAVVYQMLSM